jgi:glutathione S-transferase
MFKVYGDSQSGNCYKVQLLMHHLDIEHEWLEVDILAGETRSEAFLAKNPNGKIPLLELPSGEYLSESNAILNYLAHGTEFLPDTPLERAKVLSWQFFEQYSHEPYIAVARFIAKYLGLPEERRQEYAAKQRGGHKALSVMERALSASPYLVGTSLTIADISLYAYTHVAHEGGFELSGYPQVQAWLLRVAAHPKHVAMTQLVASEGNPEELFVPAAFEVPQQMETDQFRLRMLSTGDVEKDYEAVVSSAERLRAMFQQWKGWPREGFTVEENLEDLRRHQKEFERREAFAYTVVRLDETAVLGCVYINPSQHREIDAEVLMWVRESEYEKGLDSALFQTVEKWLKDRWPFEKVVYPGRA